MSPNPPRTARMMGQPNGQPREVTAEAAETTRKLVVLETECAVLRSAVQKLQDQVRQLERLVANGAHRGG